MSGNKSLYLVKAAQLKTPVRRLIKLIVSAGLLAWMVSKISLQSLGASLNRCDWPGLALAFVLVNLCMLVSVLKWRPLLTVQQVPISFISLLSFYYAGLFANNFLPSGIGGDALRIYDVARTSGKPKEAAASVVMERLLASLALALTAAAALAFMTEQGGSGYINWLVGGIVLVCLAALGILFLCPFKEDGKAGRWLRRLGEYKEHPGTLAKVLLYSFLFQGLLVLSNSFIFKAAGAEVPLLRHFLYVPVIMAVSMLPLSVNGLGIREGMYVALYGHSGLDPGTALLCSLLFFGQVTATSLAGGAIIALRK